MLLNEDATPYTNKQQKTITLCGEINYEGDDSRIKLQQALDQIKLFNVTHSTKITNHTIIFPYHAGPLHWNLGSLDLTIKFGSVITEPVINLYEPFGGQATHGKDNIESIVRTLSDFDKTSVIKANVNHNKQQNDSTSCGAITAENGKEFLKIKKDYHNLLNVKYGKGAKQLRTKHIEEIQDQLFNHAQSNNEVYEPKGDKPIENQYDIIKSLKKLIEEPDNNWVTEVIKALTIKQINTKETDNIRRDNL